MGVSFSVSLMNVLFEQMEYSLEVEELFKLGRKFTGEFFAKEKKLETARRGLCWNSYFRVLLHWCFNQNYKQENTKAE